MSTSSQIATRGLFHIGIIKDVDRTARRFWDDLGIGPWQILTLFESGRERVSLRGEPSSLQVRAGIAEIGSLMVALDQPLGHPHPYEEIVERRGGGAHHLALFVDRLDEATEAMERLGYPVISSAEGFGPAGDAAAAYFDTVENLGTVIELATMPSQLPTPQMLIPDPAEADRSQGFPFSKTAHVAIAVRDAEKAAARYWDELGVGPWQILTFGPEIERATYRGREGPVEIRCAVAQVGPVQIVLEQPLTSPSPLGGFLDASGPGIHHICLLVDDLKAAAGHLEGRGYEPLATASGFGPNRDGEAIYFDTDRDLGVVIELARAPSGAVPVEKTYPASGGTDS